MIILLIIDFIQQNPRETQQVECYSQSVNTECDMSHKIYHIKDK